MTLRNRWMNDGDGVRRGGPPAAPGSLLGIPEGDLTPMVRATLAGLIGELRHLRLDLAREKEKAHRLAALADQDALTPCLNRRAFRRELSRMLAFAERYRTPSSLVYIDVNDMKRINDGHGHAAGDAALRHVASALAENVRSFADDLASKDAVQRAATFMRRHLSGAAGQ